VECVEEKVLRKIFGAKRDEVPGVLRRLHTEELNDLYCPQNIMQMKKSRDFKWTGNVTPVG
jgi:hypothetical protein